MARPALIHALTDLQVATNFGGPSPIAAEIVWITPADGSYRKHIAATRARLSRARRDAATTLKTLGVIPWIMPRGGLYLWCQLPEGMDAGQIVKRVLERGIVLARGNVFSHSGTAAGFIRLNVSQMPQPVYDASAEVLRQTT